MVENGTIRPLEYKTEAVVHVDALSRNPLASCILIGGTGDSINSRLKKAQREDPGIK